MEFGHARHGHRLAWRERNEMRNSAAGPQKLDSKKLRIWWPAGEIPFWRTPVPLDVGVAYKSWLGALISFAPGWFSSGLPF